MTKKVRSNSRGVSRRDLLKAAMAAPLLFGAGGASDPRKVAVTSERAGGESTMRGSGKRGRYNILFILTDQERYFSHWPFPVPGRERLRRMGVSFENHQINANVCTSSRSVIYTGQHIQHTRMFDNVNAPWVPDLSTDIPTLGHMLRAAGYYTAYKGKWHLTREFEETNTLEAPKKIFTEKMEEYGFSDYMGIGDIIASTQGGYYHDEIITAMAVRWLKYRGAQMAQEGHPWFLAVNLVNPHDVMYFNTDAPGEQVQTRGPLLMRVNRAPNTPLYQAEWETPLAASRHQSFTGKGRPGAHSEYQSARAALVGNFPDEDPRWRRLQDYYFNCIRDSDQHVARLLTELDHQGLTDKTIIVLTADHGELAGAHGMHGKGVCAYKEQNHVPLIMAHPGVAGGRVCKAITSHLDLAPTLVSLTGLHDRAKGNITGHLKGRDFSRLLTNPAKADVNAVHPATLFNFNMLLYQDAHFLNEIARLKAAGQTPMEIKRRGLKMNLTRNRGAIRSVFDGRYRFSRYFAPTQHHRPASLEELTRHNELELYDLQDDPTEVNNLAVDLQKNGDLIIAMNNTLNALIDKEVGEDEGQMMPATWDTNWAITSPDP